MFFVLLLGQSIFPILALLPKVLEHFILSFELGLGEASAAEILGWINVAADGLLLLVVS